VFLFLSIREEKQMTEMNLILTLSLVTFGLVSFWMYQTKVEAEEGLTKKSRVVDDKSQRDS